MKTFQPFRLDTLNQCLWRADERVPLTPKAFDVLRYLVERADRLVTQDEILEALWPETYVNSEGIRKYILEIRRVLGDRPDQPLFVRTFPKRGYQFVAQVTDDRAIAVSPASPDANGNIVGREAALGQLNGHVEKALAGQRQVVFVTGDAGIGKTMLVDVFQRQAAQHPSLRIARGQCIEGFGGKEAYYPMLEALGTLVQGAQDDAVIETLVQRAPTWLIQFPSLVKAEQRESLKREILGSTRGRMVREICEALEAMTAQSPLIVILEDLHWGDASTLDLISAFARRREPAKLLLLGTYRPVDVVLSQSPLKPLKQDLLVRRLCHEIALERLEESDVAEYLARAFTNSSFPPELASLIHHNSGGNALFMVTIVQEMAKRGLIAKDGEGWTLTAPLRDIYPGIPETLQEMLEIQFEQLSAEEQRILETCSVVGERFSVWAAAGLLATVPTSIEDACDKLAQRQQFIRFAGSHEAANGAGSSYYEFRHSLYRQALYRRLSSVNRSKLHLSLGEQLWTVCISGRRELASEVALHFEEGRDYEQATRCLTLAAQNATTRFAYRDSIRVLQHALELAPLLAAGARSELETHILQSIGDAHFALGEMTDSAMAYEKAAARAADGGLAFAQVDALLHLAVPAWYLDPVHGNEVSQRAVDVCQSLDDPLLAARTQLAAASLRLLYNSWSKEDEETCAHAQETIRRLGDSSIQQNVFYTCVQTVQGHYQEALQEVEGLIAATTNPTAHILGLTSKSLTLMRCGRFGEVLRNVRTATELAKKNGEDPWIHIYTEAWLRALCFDYEGVRRLGKLIMRSNSEQHGLRARTIAAVASGYLEILRGKCDEALQCFARVRDFQITPRFFLHWYWRIQAELGAAEAWLSAGDVANARREADGFLESALSTADPNMRALAWEIKSRVARTEQDFDGAREYIDNALAILGRFDIPVVAWRVHGTASDLYGHEGENEKAEGHRARARDVVMRLADSFEPGEPLRESLLSAPPVRRIFEQAEGNHRSQPSQTDRVLLDRRNRSERSEWTKA